MSAKKQTEAQSITQRAMLIRLSITHWGGRTSDDRMVDDIVASRKNERDAVEARKILLNPEAMRPVLSVRAAARRYLFSRTSPWLDDGVRVLPSAFYFELCEKMREYQSEYEAAVLTRIVNPYEKLKSEARNRLGDLYREEDYPTVEKLRSKYVWSMGVMPIPSKDDWRVNLGDKDNAEIQKQIDAQVKTACANVTADLFQRLQALLVKVADTLSNDDSKFRDSLITNVSELCDILPALNVANDARLDAVVKETKAMLSRAAPATLREDKKARKVVKNDATDLLAKMAGYIGSK